MLVFIWHVPTVNFHSRKCMRTFTVIAVSGCAYQHDSCGLVFVCVISPTCMFSLQLGNKVGNGRLHHDVS